MKRKILMIIGALCALGLLSLVIGEMFSAGDTDKEEEVATYGDGVTESAAFYTYAQVEKMVSYLANTQDEEKALSRLIDPMNKSNYVTVEYVKKVAGIIGASGDTYGTLLKGKREDDRVSASIFDEIYMNFVSTGLVQGLEEQGIFVYSITEYTDDNGKSVSRLSDLDESYLMDTEISQEYEGKIISVYLKNDIIFKVNGLSDENVVFSQAWIMNSDDDKCTFLYDGQKNTYNISEGATVSDAVANIKNDMVADITMDNSGIVMIKEYKDIIEDRVTDVTDTVLSLEKEGNVSYIDGMRIFSLNEDNVPQCHDSAMVLKGYSSVSLVMEDGKAVAAITGGNPVSEPIRVILSNNNYSSYDIPMITFSCDSSYRLEYSDGSTSTKEEGKTVTISYKDYEKGDKITVIPDKEDACIEILSMERSYGNPRYQGKIEIRVLEDSLNVINEVPLETYLYSVVSSEMPSGCNEEALKAMAICTRGYAYVKMHDKSFDAYHAHLDDSTLCQVYNNVYATAESVKAVRDTYGMVPVYEDKVIVPLYFSTSCGTTCTNDEIWGGQAYPYYMSCLDTIEKQNIDLSSEEAFEDFIDNGPGYETIDHDMPYYRWSIAFTREEISQAVNSMLEERISISSDNIKEKNQDGELKTTDITDIGEIKSIKVVERSKSGVVNTIEIQGSLATVQISGQTNIRNIITPVNQDIIRQDKSKVTGWTSLPSPYYYVKEENDGFVIYGGGFGHGVGMSQSGAEILAEQGYNYKFILRHYYSYIKFSSIYSVESGKDE